MKMCKQRAATCLVILSFVMILAIYHQCGYRPSDGVITENVRPVSVRFHQTMVKSDSQSQKVRFTEKTDYFPSRCSPVKNIHHNGADIQISDVVEALPFHPEQPDRGHYPNLKPLSASQELTVFLVPHSHCDPGWLLTYDEYYEKKVRHVLTNLYQFAMEHEDFKYIYAEVSFFKLWWEEQSPGVKENMGRLAREGRFEFVQGGWVQNDEANTHYFAILNQMLDGHEWLKKHFPDAKPRVGWAIDPFGLSPFMGQVNKLFGLQAMHIQRVHYTVKKHLAENKRSEFRWRQSWDSNGETDILTHMGPFAGYNFQSGCGPDPDVCLQYHFRALIDYSGFRRHRELVETTDANVKKRSLKILDQWRKKAALHSGNAVFIELGADFAYDTEESLQVVYNNYKPIMEYINSSPELRTEVKWGTVSDYFDHISKKPGKFLSLSGDFFTYADRLDQYWSGYFTTRPFYKNLDRVLESSLRRAEILFSFHRAKEGVSELIAARHTLSLFQHHDGITGTSKPAVAEDYGSRLIKAYKACEKLSVAAIQHIMNESAGRDFQPIRQRAGFKELEKYRVLEKPEELVITNTIARKTDSVQVIAVKSHLDLEIVRIGGEVIPQQVEPAIEYGKFDPNSKFIVFRTELPSVSINTFQLKNSTKENMKARIVLYNFGSKSKAMETLFQSTFDVKTEITSQCDDIILGTGDIALILNCKSGRLKSIKKGKKAVAVEQEILLHTSSRNGAYLFFPNRDPIRILTDSTRPEILVVKGSLRDKAVVTLKFQESAVILTYIVHHHSDSVELEVMTDLKDYGDLAIRLKTDIKNGDSVFTDLNGHTIQHRKFKKKLPAQGNFFPMPSTAFIQDSSTRLSLLGSEPHGVASLAEGWIEVILDRRTARGDGKGMGEGIKDNIPTPAHLRILVETRSATQRDPDLYLVEYPSLVSHRILQSLLHPAFILFAPLSRRRFPVPSIQLMKTLPCDEELVNLRYIEDKTSQLIRRKLGFTCDIDISTTCDCQMDDMDISELFTTKVTVQHRPFSPFHQRSNSNDSTFDLTAMKFSSQYVMFSK